MSGGILRSSIGILPRISCLLTAVCFLIFGGMKSPLINSTGVIQMHSQPGVINILTSGGIKCPQMSSTGKEDRGLLVIVAAIISRFGGILMSLIGKIHLYWQDFAPSTSMFGGTPINMTGNGVQKSLLVTVINILIYGETISVSLITKKDPGLSLYAGPINFTNGGTPGGDLIGNVARCILPGTVPSILKYGISPTN